MIVKPTDPPSMAVVVTHRTGDVPLIVQPAHPLHARVDTVTAADDTLTVWRGDPSENPTLGLDIPGRGTPIAHITVVPGQLAIEWADIVNVGRARSPHTEPGP